MHHNSAKINENPMHKEVSPVAVAPAQNFEVEVGKTSTKDVENQQTPAASNVFIKFWNSGGKYMPVVIGPLIAYIVLLVLAGQQANSAESSSRSAIYTTPNIDNTGWNVRSAVTPYSYGGIWNPAAYALGSGSVNNSQVGARIEMSLSSFSPSYTGGTASVLFRLILNPNWMDTTQKPAKPLFNVSCYVGNSLLSLTSASTSFYVDFYTSNFPFDSGTILKYPLDSFQVQSNIYCTYVTYDTVLQPNSIRDGYLNFNLAVGNTDVGLFTPSAKFQDPSASSATIYYTTTDDYEGPANTHTGNYSYINIDSESVTLRLTRGNINVFFPIFITIIMWLLIVAESLIFIPYYLEKKKADAPGIPLGCVGILFALPNIRNTMPGAPPLGVMLDFAAYFWCLTIAAGHFLMVSWYWVGLASNFSSKDIVANLLGLFGRKA